MPRSCALVKQQAGGAHPSVVGMPRSRKQHTAADDCRVSPRLFPRRFLRDALKFWCSEAC
jgi:hypothetical protein